jgi:hypothetical protein
MSLEAVFMKPLKAAGLCALILVAGLVAGCSQEMRSQIGDLFRIRGELSRKFGHENVTVRVHNGTFLAIGFVNSPFNALAAAEKEQKAHDIALHAVSLLDRKTAIERIAVTFTVHETKWFVVHYTNSLDTYSFDVRDLQKELDGAPRQRPQSQQDPRSPRPGQPVR